MAEHSARTRQRQAARRRDYGRELATLAQLYGRADAGPIPGMDAIYSPHEVHMNTTPDPIPTQDPADEPVTQQPTPPPRSADDDGVEVEDTGVGSGSVPPAADQSRYATERADVGAYPGPI